MKVLHLIPSYYPATQLGGPIQSVHLLNKSLVKKDIKVDVFTLNAGLENRNFKENFWYDYEGVRVKYFRYSSFFRYALSFKFFYNVLKVIKDYDIVHITAIWNFPVLAGMIAALYYKIPFIISPRGTLYKETINLKAAFVKKIYWTFILKNFIKKASAIHFTTLDEKEKVTNYLKLQCESVVIPNGLNLTILHESNKMVESKLTNYILFIGRISKKKGFDILIPAFAILAAHFDLKLVIAGPDDQNYKKEVLKLIESEKVADKVIFTGMLDDEKWSLYKNALMFVLPSYSENFGMAVIEAMVCGTPVVISNKVGIHDELSKAAAGIVVDTSIKSVYEGMKLLIDDKKLREQISINGTKLVRVHYNIEKISELMIAAYRSIINNCKNEK